MDEREGRVDKGTKGTTRKEDDERDEEGKEVDEVAEEDKGYEVGERYTGNIAEEWDKVDEGE